MCSLVCGNSGCVVDTLTTSHFNYKQMSNSHSDTFICVVLLSSIKASTKYEGPIGRSHIGPLHCRDLNNAGVQVDSSTKIPFVCFAVQAHSSHLWIAIADGHGSFSQEMSVDVNANYGFSGLSCAAQKWAFGHLNSAYALEVRLICAILLCHLS